MIDTARMRRRLLELLAIPSPCGFTDEIVHYVGDQLRTMDIGFDLTRRGTIRARLPGRDRGPARALVNHVDTLGAMVRLVRPDGRLSVMPIGFWSSRFAEGTRVTLFSEHHAYRGTLLPCLNWGVSRDRGVEQVPLDWDHIELRLDEAVLNDRDVRNLGIEVGDFISLDANPEVLDNGYIVARGLDNKAGVTAVMETLQHLKEENLTPVRDLHVLFTVTETIGTGTGAAVSPDVSELVTVDFASVPATEKSPFKRVTIASADAAGPYDYHLTAHLQRLATELEIPHQKKLLEAFHSDTAAALAAGHDVRTAVLAYAGDASHSLERTHLSSLQNIARLLCAYATSEPTFARDTSVIDVEDFSHQLHEHQLPDSPERGPSAAELLGGRDGTR